MAHIALAGRRGGAGGEGRGSHEGESVLIDIDGNVFVLDTLLSMCVFRGQEKQDDKESSTSGLNDGTNPPWC